MALWLNCPIMISYQKNQKRELVYEQIHKKKIKDLRKTKKKKFDFLSFEPLTAIYNQ